MRKPNRCQWTEGVNPKWIFCYGPATYEIWSAGEIIGWACLKHAHQAGDAGFAIRRREKNKHEN